MSLKTYKRQAYPPFHLPKSRELEVVNRGLCIFLGKVVTYTGRLGTLLGTVSGSLTLLELEIGNVSFHFQMTAQKRLICN